jgi:hypothetical protein
MNHAAISSWGVGKTWAIGMDLRLAKQGQSISAVARPSQVVAKPWFSIEIPTGLDAPILNCVGEVPRSQSLTLEGTWRVAWNLVDFSNFALQ